MSSIEKRIVFTDTDKRHADLKIRLHYDGLRQAEFFRLFITEYLKNNELIRTIIDEYKEANSIQSKLRRRKSKKLYDQAKKLKKQFGLDENMIEDIFDIMEEEHPDL